MENQTLRAADDKKSQGESKRPVSPGTGNDKRGNNTETTKGDKK